MIITDYQKKEAILPLIKGYLQRNLTLYIKEQRDFLDGYEDNHVLETWYDSLRGRSKRIASVFADLGGSLD